jgi:hypothetical protein
VVSSSIREFSSNTAHNLFATGWTISAIAHIFGLLARFMESGYRQIEEIRQQRRQDQANNQRRGEGGVEGGPGG